LSNDINFSDCFFIGVSIYIGQTQKEMDTALDYVGLAATTGLSAYVLEQLLSGGSANRQLYHGMTTATAVGIATGVGSMVAKAGHDYVTSLRPINGKLLSRPHLMQEWPALVPGAMSH